ncbi:apoptosis-associated speck-like protein containing a CARD isoform X1 [Hippoglossus hippoglossus]|uniref:apoptosis-associated speck-like protein containing a CARD isoform X1 n=1 Tax=Hippoglossus hippoglossus TaxID=8267 RepID=UPI00148BFC9C|nr:apoptosis-associated speck-like protein containing a CARD isoform X1 [Hippoglossus hippoglossus]XP_035020114.1 apoptosis-associated speck-like protein containing a CARD isoform X1 [Hippoglossus stenolepis]
MAPKSAKKLLADTLEDLSEQNLVKFRHQLLDRREEPRVRRSRVEGKNFLDLTDVLVSTFTERAAVSVAAEILREIDCNQEAERLVEEFAKLSSNSGSSDAAKASSGATAGNGKAEGGCSEKHFVDKHKLQLISRVSCIEPILDELLEKDVIQQEAYAKIRALLTSQEKMRELFSTSLRASETCRDIFYEILKKNEPYLVEDLQGK